MNTGNSEIRLSGELLARSGGEKVKPEKSGGTAPRIKDQNVNRGSTIKLKSVKVKRENVSHNAQPGRFKTQAETLYMEIFLKDLIKSAHETSKRCVADHDLQSCHLFLPVEQAELEEEFFLQSRLEEEVLS